MQMESSIFLPLLLNIGLLLAFSWFSVKLLSNSALRTDKGDQRILLVSKVVSDSALIMPRIKKLLVVRRMIKTDSGSDETPYFLPQF